MVEQIVLSRLECSTTCPLVHSAGTALACISQLVNHGAYEALASELFRSDYSELSGVNAFAWMAGLMPELARKNNAGLILWNIATGKRPDR